MALINFIMESTSEMQNKSEMKNKIVMQDRKFIFYTSFNESNTDEDVKNVVDNIKRFKSETNSFVKYNYVKNAFVRLLNKDDKETKQSNSHIYFKLKVSEIAKFKEYHPNFSKSKFFTHSTYECTDEEKEMLINSKNSFLNIYYDKENNVFNIKSNTTKNSHFYLFKKIFIENGKKMDFTKFKYVRNDKD